VQTGIVARASGGSEAVALAIVHQPDIILIDVNLPPLGGIQVTYSIKETCPWAVVIGLAEHFTPSIYSAMRTAGAAAFVCKREVLGIKEVILCTMANAKQYSRWVA
jgi:two-component system response regulator DesR